MPIMLVSPEVAGGDPPITNNMGVGLLVLLGACMLVGFLWLGLLLLLLLVLLEMEQELRTIKTTTTTTTTTTATISPTKGTTPVLRTSAKYQRLHSYLVLTL